MKLYLVIKLTQLRTNGSNDLELRDVNAFQSMDRNDKERYMIQKPSLNHPAIIVGLR